MPLDRSHSDSLPEEQREQIDRLADQFEREFKVGQDSRIEAYLEPVPELRSQLLKELIAMEVELRRAAKQQPRAEEYRQRFADEYEIIEAIFSDAQGSEPAADSTINQPPAPDDTDVEGEPVPERLGRYEIQRRLGGGGFGVVYLGHDPQLDRPVALKVPRRKLLRSPEQIARFIEEARTAARLKHSAIVTVYDVQEHDGWPYIVQEYIDGPDLAEWAATQRPSHQQIAKVLIGIAEAVGYAHQQGLTHCDLKLANVLMDNAGGPHVADFGLALHESVQQLHKGEVFGTPAVMAPEQVRGESHRLDGRTDIWAMGVMLYELLVGRRPFGAESRDEVFEDIQQHDPKPPRQIDRSVPRELERICLKCLAKRRTERYNITDDLREDLQAWLDEEPQAELSTKSPQLTTVAATPDSSSGSSIPVKIIPKGLRSFDAEDADFFLELLPGPRDREGLPESIRFWKHRIEETDPDKTFAVGVMYGPSGCGKSSLVKAGLLPRLNEHVVVVSMEATPDDTEVRLLKGLQKHLPNLDTDKVLPEVLAGVREQGFGGGRKLLLVIDQFEQWLHVHGGEASSQLLNSLRQCDGGNVQCLVLVREEYTMPCLRFLDGLETKIHDGENFGVVDLFDQRHSQKVLRLFGEAYGALPDTQIASEQEQFVEQSVQGLADDKGRVICVRLALYAEMVKDKTWVPSTLHNLGGAEGVGITFLEETLSAETAKPTYRRHQKEAQRVLKALLPPSEADSIKGSMRSYKALLDASECERPADFGAVITMLDQELRLITPTDPEGREQGDNDSDGAGQTDKYYQLTHDYLVPSLRRWLTHKQGETRRGRAELRLAERSALWNAKPENRHLPSLWEDIRIRALTRLKDWTPSQRAMMRRSGHLHTLRVISAVAILLIASAGVLYARNRLEARSRERLAKRLVDQILTADIGNLQTPLDELTNVRDLADPLLRSAFESADDDSPQKLNASLALLDSEPVEQTTYLRKRLPALLPSQVRVVRQALSETSQVESVANDLWTDLSSRGGEDAAVLPLASTLAILTPSDPRWSEAGSPVAEALVRSDTVYFGGWLELLEDVRKELLPHLSQIYCDDSENSSPAHRKQATKILRQFAFDQPRLLAELLMAADKEQFQELFPPAAKPENASEVLAIMRGALAKRSTHDWKDPPEDPTWLTPTSDALLAIEAAHGVLDTELRFAFCQTMPWDAFFIVAEELRPCGFRPTRVRPFVDAEDLRIAAVWTRDGGTWVVDKNLTSAQLPPPDTAAEKDGMVPIDLSAYRTSGVSEDESPELRYLLVWGPPETADEQRRVSYSLTEQQLEQVHAKLKQEKFAAQATLQVSVDDKGQRHYTGIWSNQGAEATPVPAYAGWQRVDQPQWDISLAAAGKLPDPLDHYRQQLTVIQQAPPEQVDTPRLRLVRAVVNYRLGDAQASLNDLDFLIRQDASSATVIRYRALALARLRKAEEARAALEAFLAQDDNQTLSGYMQVMVSAWLGEVAAAQKSLDDLVAAANGQGEVLYDAACAATQASMALADHGAEQAQSFRDRAFDLLRQAQEAGYRDGNHLCADADLAPLHSDRRFAELVYSIALPARYATLLRADIEYESRLLSKLPPEEQLHQSRPLIAAGYRPLGITVALLEADGREAASVWIRPLVADEDKEQLALRQANAAVALARLGPADEVWPLLKHSPDPRLRSYVIDRFASFGADPTAPLVRYKTEPEPSIRRALLLTLGNFAAANLLDTTQREELAVDLLRLYREDPDRGIHGAAEWTLRQLGQVSQIEAAQAALATGQVVGERQWYVTKTGAHKLAVIQPQGPFPMGSPVWEAERDDGPTGPNELRHRRKLPRQYAIATHEVTVAQFQEFRDDHDFKRQYAREESAPANLVTWYDAAAFCNWLSREEDIPEQQWCYDPSQPFSDGMKLYPDYLRRTGYRLPTEAEWEYACRAGAVTARYYGATATLLERYAWYKENSQERLMLPVGSLQPNDLGLFDMLGNANEWCQDLPFPYPSDRPLVEDSEQTGEVRGSQSRAVRGGSFSYSAAHVRSANRDVSRPDYRDLDSGFRVARTYNLSP